MTKPRKIFFSILLIVLVSFGLSTNSGPVQAAAVVYDPLYYLEEFVLHPLVRKIANSLENKLANRVNKLISNIDGKSPAFITNWRNHIFDSQARGNDVFRSVLADTKLCSYFNDDLKKIFGADKFTGAIAGAKVKDVSGKVVYENKTGVPGLPSFQLAANCSLPADFDVSLFKKDFNKGGWEAWGKLIEPQNNFYGAFALALQEQQNQIAVEKQAAQDSSIAGQGFLSQKLGVGNSGIGPTGCTSWLQGAGLGGALLPVTRCVFLGKEITPAQILGETAANTLDTKLKKIGGSRKIVDILLSLFATIVEGTTDRLANFTAQRTYDRPPAAQPTPRPGDFNEQQFEPGSGDPNAGGLVNPINTGAQQSCLNSCLANERQSCSQITDPQARQDCLGSADSTCRNQCSLPGSAVPTF